MKIELIHHEVRRKWELHNNQRKSLSSAEVDMNIQAACDYYIDYAAYGRNPKSFDMGAESTMQRTEMLAGMVDDVSITSLTTHADGSYEYILPSNFHSMRDGYLVSDCGNLKAELVPHDEILDSLGNVHRAPSKKFRRALAVRRGDNLNLYVPSGLTIGALMLYYYRVPARVSLGNYPALPNIGEAAGPNLAKTECDLPAKYHWLVVDIAVQELNRIYGDLNRLKTFDQKQKEVT